MASIKASRLPEGYYECEYIESDGTNFVDTGFAPDNNTRVVCDFEFMDTPSGHTCIFGSRTSDASTMFEFFWHDSYDYFCSNYQNYGRHTWSVDPVGRYIVDKDKETTTFNGTSESYTNTEFTLTHNIYLFALNKAGTAQWHATARIYSCRIYDNGVMVRDYVPCVNPEGCFGLYDLVTNGFYGLVKPETRQSYTVNLNSQWQKGSVTNPDSSVYDGVYQSYSNYNVHSSAAIMTITITGYTEFTCYIRSYAESTYDYVMIGELDSVLTSSSTYSSTGVKAHTRGNQQSGTAIGSYTEVSYTDIDGGTHTIYVVYRKDGSVNSNDDRGYLLIDKSTG